MGRDGSQYLPPQRRQSVCLEGRSGRVHGEMEVRVHKIGNHIPVSYLMVLSPRFVDFYVVYFHARQKRGVENRCRQTLTINQSRLKRFISQETDIFSTKISWIANLGTFFHAHGLSNVDATTFPPIHEQRKAFTDNGLMGLENTCDMFTLRERNSELGAKSQWRELFEKMVMETKKGASITADLIVVIGQKPE